MIPTRRWSAPNDTGPRLLSFHNEPQPADVHTYILNHSLQMYTHTHCNIYRPILVVGATPAAVGAPAGCRAQPLGGPSVQHEHIPSCKAMVSKFKHGLHRGSPRSRRSSLSIVEAAQGPCEPSQAKHVVTRGEGRKHCEAGG